MRSRDEIKAETLRAFRVDLEITLQYLMKSEWENDASIPVFLVWEAVNDVIQAAWVEHARLTGQDTYEAERELRAQGVAPWRDRLSPMKEV